MLFYESVQLNLYLGTGTMLLPPEVPAARRATCTPKHSRMRSHYGNIDMIRDVVAKFMYERYWEGSSYLAQYVFYAHTTFFPALPRY